MPRTSPHRSNDTPTTEPVERPPEEVAGDIRDRLTVLINTAQVLRLSSPADARVMPVVRLIEQQVECLGRLADEICRDRWPDPAGALASAGSGPSSRNT